MFTAHPPHELWWGQIRPSLQTALSLHSTSSQNTPWGGAAIVAEINWICPVHLQERHESAKPETQYNQDEEKAYLCKNKTNSEDFNVEKYRKASENTHIIISVYDQKLLDSMLGSPVKKDTILKWIKCI